jgi:hypothetical protein
LDVPGTNSTPAFSNERRKLARFAGSAERFWFSMSRIDVRAIFAVVASFS